MLEVDILSLFPAMLDGFLSESIVGRAIEQGHLDIHVRDIRDWATNKHRTADDRPFGGGAGMVLKPDVLFPALEALRRPDSHTIYLCPDGELLTMDIVRELAARPHLILLSGHYEGIDQRVRDELIDRELSIGDYVLTNGTLPAAVLTDAVARQIPGVLGEEKSLTQDSFNDNLLSFPQYTRPAEYRGKTVPDVLLRGHHEEIAAWRRQQQLDKTQQRRPDLFEAYLREQTDRSG